MLRSGPTICILVSILRLLPGTGSPVRFALPTIAVIAWVTAELRIALIAFTSRIFRSFRRANAARTPALISQVFRTLRSSTLRLFLLVATAIDTNIRIVSSPAPAAWWRTLLREGVCWRLLSVAALASWLVFRKVVTIFLAFPNVFVAFLWFHLIN